MFGHVEGPDHVAEHLLAVRDLQAETGGFTEFVPLPFIHAEAPMFRTGAVRRGPTFREVTVLHAVARLVLGPLIPNIQASWVKLGRDGVTEMLRAGVNDLGGVLMNESISRAAGASHGQELNPLAIERIAAGCGRPARQRTTLYGDPHPDQLRKSFAARALADIELTPVRRKAPLAGELA
jgi:FO synthase